MAEVTRLRLPELSATADLLSIGSTRIYRVADIEGIGWPAKAMFGSLTQADLAAAAARLPESAVDAANATLDLSFNSYVIARPGLTVLIDAGIGNDKERPDRPAWHRRSGRFLDVLTALGFPPDSIDLVVNTHLHADHVGWNTVHDGQRWRPTFARARYVAPRAELDHWSALHDADPSGATLHGAFVDSVLPLVEAGVLTAVETPAEIAPGLSLEPAPGHSPGMTIVRLKTEENDVCFLADLIHHPIQLIISGLNSNFCGNPSEALSMRDRILRRCAGEHMIVAPYHFAPPSFGRIEEAGSEVSFRYLPVSRDQVVLTVDKPGKS